jgi:hypothetical protein
MRLNAPNAREMIQGHLLNRIWNSFAIKSMLL